MGEATHNNTAFHEANFFVSKEEKVNERNQKQESSPQRALQS
jgi:hypothetical protein